MTAIKQKAVCSPGHWKNVAKYLDDERALARASQNLADESRWAAEMDATREAYGHNAPGKKGAKCTYAYHQVLAFNPDECSCNGGRMTPEACMEYARQYVEGRYGAYEAAWVLHLEHCAADGTDRYAVHMVVNRTNLETGRRLNEGRSKNAKIERANAVRDMDAKWGLAQMREGERNCRIHAQHPTKRELAIAARGARSDKQYIRDAVAAATAWRASQRGWASRPQSWQCAASTRRWSAEQDAASKRVSVKQPGAGARLLYLCEASDSALPRSPAGQDHLAQRTCRRHVCEHKCTSCINPASDSTC